ncbi:MAG TPA: glycosyltransferase family 9 protein [Longimicrobiaceae bacterium]|nr:glycosyltransferase family 9 protein [Longimicrobiaceae bacterium]
MAPGPRSGAERAAQLFRVAEPLEVHVRYYGRGAGPEAYAVVSAGEDPPADDAGGRLALRLEPGASYLANSPVFFAALRLHHQERRRSGLPGVAQVLSAERQAAALGRPGMPARLGRGGEALAPFLARAAGRQERLRVAVANIWHLAFGDALAGLCALRELRAALEARFARVELTLFQHRCNAEAEQLFRRSGVVDEVRFLPAPLAALAEHDAWVDVSGVRVSPREHWVDQCLAALGMDPAAVPAARKRLRVPAAPWAARELAAEVAALKAEGGPVLLFHPQASLPARSFPADAAAAFARALLERTGARVASAVPLAVDHPRFVDWSPLSRTFDHFAFLVSQADGVVSVDTCAYHLADAFDVPAVALFTPAVPPETRIAYSPRVAGITVAPERPGGAPAWERLDAGRVLAALASCRPCRLPSA